MADITMYLKKILEAVYGEEVRGSIHDALAAMNTESNRAMEFASTAKDSAQASAASAKGAADTASVKAGESADSAGAARASETNAREAENNAASRAAEAVNAAASAQASETNAAGSEAAAARSASEAEAAQNAAALSKADALATAQRVQEVKIEVEAVGTQAAVDREEAEAARDAAETSRDAAAVSAASAEMSAGDATAAKDAAVNAQTAAETAKTAAEVSRTAAEASKNSAESSENGAAESERNAAASAETAKQYSGKPPKPQNGTWWIWDAAQQKYIDSGIGCDLVGPTGNGIENIQLTKGDHTPGTADIYTVTMTDGTTYNISVYNGRNGTGTGDVLGIWFDLVIPASGWANGEITIADSRLIALSTHKYFVSADEASREEYLECNVQPRDITTTGFITFKNDTDPSEDITVNVIRFELSANGTT